MVELDAGLKEKLEPLRQEIMYRWPIASAHGQVVDIDKAAQIVAEHYEAENFSLAANICHHGYAGDNGDHRCRYQDQLSAANCVVEAAKEVVSGHAVADTYGCTLCKLARALDSLSSTTGEG